MWRLWAVFAFIIILLLCVIAKLFYWQIIAGESLRTQAASQYYLELTLPAVRGQIFSSDNMPLVMNKTAYLVYAEPKKLEKNFTIAKLLSPLLSTEEATLSAMLSLPDRVWLPLAHKVDETKVGEIKAMDIKGIGFEKEPTRYYPESSMAAHLLGFVASDNNGNDKGYFGLEGYYDRELKGKDGVMRIDKDVRGAPILIGESRRIEAEDGRSLTLWVDRTIQHIVETHLKEGIEKYGAKEGTVVMMDPSTGGVLAMASYPSYDPEKYHEYDDTLFKNPIVVGAYEPGSTFKSLIMSAGINEHVITPNTTINESGPVQVGEYAIRTWDNKYHGTITMTEVLEHSSNVGMVEVSKRLGKDKLLKYIKDFGFGQPTGVDLEEETSPDLRADREWREIDLATASFGQGIAVTPLQMVRAGAALANGGWLMEPHVVREIRDSRGKVVPIKPKKIRQVISGSTAKIMTEMMVEAVDNGEAKWAKPKGYRIAGKTGTAQIPVAGHYDDKKTIASFIGFAPADNPKFVMLVTLREPSSSQWGSETAAPLFFTISRDVFNYLGIPPTQ